MFQFVVCDDKLFILVQILASTVCALENRLIDTGRLLHPSLALGKDHEMAVQVKTPLLTTTTDGC
jgi:hypothetical protein